MTIDCRPEHLPRLFYTCSKATQNESRELAGLSLMELTISWHRKTRRTASRSRGRTSRRSTPSLSSTTASANCGTSSRSRRCVSSDWRSLRAMVLLLELICRFGIHELRSSTSYSCPSIETSCIGPRAPFDLAVHRTGDKANPRTRRSTTTTCKWSSSSVTPRR